MASFKRKMNSRSHAWENPKGKGITMGRRISRILSFCACYNPSNRRLRKSKYVRAATQNVEDNDVRNSVHTPVLDQAWAYFEHQILPRRFKGEDGYFMRAPPGDDDRETHLYPVCGTTIEELGDFGDGVGLYFYTLRYFSIVALVAGIANLPIMWFFLSKEYVGEEKKEWEWEWSLRVISKWILRGSAVCADTSWEPCPECAIDDWSTFPYTNDRFAFAYIDVNSTASSSTSSTCTSNNWSEFSATDPAILTFIKKNNCKLHEKFGLFSLASVGLFLVAVYYFIFTHNKKAIEFDEAEQSSTDYSVVIMNPPKDATDPELWKDFFESNIGNIHVTACTVTLDNNTLVEPLARRRKLLLQLQDMLPSGKIFDERNLEKSVQNCPPVPTWKKWICFASDPRDILNAIYKKHKLILDQSKKKFNVSKVFVTFESQLAQRKVLERMSSRFPWNGADRGAPKFQGTVLKVIRPAEPSDIRWNDISDSPCTQFFQRVMTVLISLAFIAGGCIFIRYARDKHAFLAPFTITIINLSCPKIVNVLTSFESHPSETSYSTSKYTKLTLFRWFFTAILTTIITPFTDTLQDEASLIYSIYILFMFDLIRFPLLQLPDIVGNFKRHVLGPRATTQRKMNVYFQGNTFCIGERFTEITRTCFLTVFYATIFPAAFFFAYAILTMIYCLDKYSLLRTWKQGPKIGAYISTFSTNIFLVITLTYTVMASYYYAHFPFDNACDTEESVPTKYIGTHCAQINDVNAGNFRVSITAYHKIHQFCKKEINYRTFVPLPYFQPEEGGTKAGSQEFSNLYGWVCVGVVLFIGCTLLLKVSINLFNILVCKSHESSCEVMDDSFSDIPERVGYVPKVDIPGYDFPFLLCDIDNIDDSLVGWRDPEKSYDLNNLIFDIPWVADYMTIKRKNERNPQVLHINDAQENVELSLVEEPANEKLNIFSIVKEWPPLGTRNLITI